jgi:hypothetical protein
MDYVANIDAAMHAADDASIAAGARWYRRMSIITHGHAARLNVSPVAIGGVYAAYSINTPWHANLRMVAVLLRARVPYRGTLTDSIEKAERILSGEDAYTVLSSKDGKSRKTRSFALACSGDYSSVVVDRWAYGVATGWAECPKHGRPCGKNGKGHACTRVPEGSEYDAIADAYRAVASMWGMEPAIVQAIVWVAARKGR